MDVLKLNNLVKRYGKDEVVKGINLKVKQGEIFGLLGPNGAGKSTTIKMITGLTSKTSGEIIYDGSNKSISQWKKNIGLVPQDLELYYDLTAYENVEFFCSIYGYKGQKLKKRVLRALEFVGLLDVKDKQAKTFSGGMQRRLNIACGIAHGPKLIIMDEPTVGIDPQSRNNILESVKKLKEEGATIIYTSHYMNEVEELCDYISIIDYGKVIAEGTNEQLKDSVKENNIYSIEIDKPIINLQEKISKIDGIKNVHIDDKKITCNYDKNNNIIEKLVSVISKENANIINMQVEQPTLETVFLKLTGKSLRD